MDEENVVTIREALENALTLLESLGYTSGGDIHDDLALAIDRLKWMKGKPLEGVL